MQGKSRRAMSLLREECLQYLLLYQTFIDEVRGQRSVGGIDTIMMNVFLMEKQKDHRGCVYGFTVNGKEYLFITTFKGKLRGGYRRTQQPARLHLIEGCINVSMKTVLATVESKTTCCAPAVIICPVQTYMLVESIDDSIIIEDGLWTGELIADPEWTKMVDEQQ